MTILGIHSGHDAACCIARDGTVVADAQEERFSRIKHSCGVPVHSLAYCLGAAGLSSINDVDCVAAGSRHLRPDLAALLGLSPGPALAAARLKPPVYLQHFFLRDPDKLLCVEHHLSHAASAHYTRSSAETCLVFTMDGEGKTMGLAPYGDARKSAGVLDRHFPALTTRSVERRPLGKSYSWPDCGAMHWHFPEGSS